MKVAIVGSRSFVDYDEFVKLLSNVLPDDTTEIVSGGAVGTDKLAERYANENNIPLTVIRPDWSLGRWPAWRGIPL